MTVAPVLLAVGVILTLSPTRVAAHPKIVSTIPAADAQLMTAPTPIRIVFSEPIEAVLVQLRLSNAQAQAIDDGTGGRSAEMLSHTSKSAQRWT